MVDHKQIVLKRNLHCIEWNWNNSVNFYQIFFKKILFFSITVKPILTWIANIIYRGLFVFSELRWQVIIHFLYIGGIVDHPCLYFFFIIITHEANHIIFLSQVTDKLYHVMLCTLPWSRCELATSMVKDTDCIASCKSNYHTITAMMALYIYIYIWIDRTWLTANKLS